MHFGDSRSSYAIVRQLAGASPSRDKSVKLSDGSVASTALERELRWQEHFANLFHGRICDPRGAPDDSANAGACEAQPDAISEQEAAQLLADIGCSPTSILDTAKKVSRGKGLGPDGIAMELVVAGGDVAAIQVFEQAKCIVKRASWPLEYKGGRIVDIFKNKGDSMVCDQSRGILLACHVFKLFFSFLVDAMNEPYFNALPPSQQGSVPGGGTDFATHVVCLSTWPR